MTILDRWYPAEVFDGSSGDVGARLVVALRDLDKTRGELKQALIDAEKWRRLRAGKEVGKVGHSDVELMVMGVLTTGPLTREEVCRMLVGQHPEAVATALDELYRQERVAFLAHTGRWALIHRA